MIREATILDIPQMHKVRMSVKENALNNPLLVTEADYVSFLMLNGKGWVYELQNEIVGLAIIDTKNNNVWALFVHPAHEKKGIGKKLQDAMLHKFFSTSHETLWLGTAPNTRAEKFYTQSGWRSSGLIEKGEMKFEMSYLDYKRSLHLDSIP